MTAITGRNVRTVPDADEKSVDQQPLQPAVVQADQSEQPGDRCRHGPVDQLGDQALKRRRELGRELEEQPHDRQEHGYAGPRVEQDGVDAIGEGAVQPPPMGGRGLVIRLRREARPDLLDHLLDPGEDRFGVGDFAGKVGDRVIGHRTVGHRADTDQVPRDRGDVVDGACQIALADVGPVAGVHGDDGYAEDGAERSRQSVRRHGRDG